MIKELVAGENRVARFDLAAPARAEMAALRQRIRSRSLLAWGEHCTECTYPSCYSVCSHYTPRADLHCRRFDRGIEILRTDDVREALMRIRFRKWGKLEAEGPRPIAGLGAAASRERLGEAMGGTMDALPVPFAVRRGLVRLWSRAAERRPKPSPGARPDHLVIECVAAGERAVPFTVTVLPNSRREAGLFQERMLLGPGYTRGVFPYDRIAAQVDLSRPFLVQLEPMEEAPPEEFVFGLADFVVSDGTAIPPVGQPTAAPRAERKTPAARAKCLVWDLDNTVWRGTLAEDGVEGVLLDPSVVEVMKELDRRGILQSVASKNDEKEGLAALAHFGIDEYMLYPQIGWGPKSDALRRIARALDIGIDTFVFVDDQPFERSEVSEALECVTCLPETDVSRLPQLPQFDVPITAESGRRRQMYREEMTRQVAFETAGTSDYHAFLRSCDIRLALSHLGPADVTRVFDLSQRTNQVNVSGTRYERAFVERMAEGAPGRHPVVMRCVDRFGDYGVVGFALLDEAAGVVEDFFMSCRVQRKYVEHALFQHLGGIVAAAGGRMLRVRYRKTDRNKLALQLLGDLGFVLHEESPGRGWLERPIEPIPSADLVTVSAEPPPFAVGTSAGRGAGAAEA